MGNYWFTKFKEDAEKLSPFLRFRRIKYGFYRIYWQDAYIGECYSMMPPYGYEKTEDNVRFMNQSYYEEYEDSAKLTREIKNFVEGYAESLDMLKTRIYMLRNNQEFRKEAKNGYKQMYVK